MKEYVLNNGFRVRVDFERARIASIYKNEEIVHGNAGFYAVKLRNKRGEARVIDSNEGTFLSFDGREAVYLHDELRVFVRVEQTGNRLVWKIKIENETEDLLEAVEIASFGVYNKLREENTGKGSVVFTYNEGVEVTNMQQRESFAFAYNEADYPSYGKYNVFPYKVASQFIAYLLNGAGVYLGMHDEERTPKHIDFRYYGDSIRLQTRVFCNVDYGEDYEMPFESVLECFDGGWERACEIYRAWFETHLPAGLKKIKDSDDLPAWYHESPIVVTYPIRGGHDLDEIKANDLYPYENGFQWLNEAANATESKVMALLMQWEGTAPWAPPYVWPPYGGEAEFKEFVQKAHEQGILVGVYGSGLGWTQFSRILPEYNREAEYIEKGLASLMCTDTVGNIESGVCQAQRKGYDFCASQDGAKDLFAGEWAKVCQSGVDYVQAFDQNHGGCGYFCYSDKHGHIPVPGKWLVDESYDLIQRVKKEGVIFGCETATSEPFLSLLRFSDNRFELNYYIGRPIPMYAFIYHEYVNNFMGNQVGMPLSREEYSYPYRVAYSFLAGDMLTAVITDKGDIAYAWCDDNRYHTDKTAAYALLKNLNGWRQKGGKAFLHMGRMVKAMPVPCGKNSFVMENRPFVADELLTSAFTDGNRTLQFIVNYNSTPKTVRFARACTVYKNPEMTEVERDTDTFVIPPLTAVAVAVTAGELQ